jgi:hypothetical protein
MNSTCYRCGYLLHSHKNETGSRPPVIGDVTLCANCGAWSIFKTNLDGPLTPQEPTIAEIVALPEDVKGMAEGIETIIKHRGRFY